MSADFATKAVAFELKADPSQDGTIEGYASTFENVDDGMDVISRGAFRDTIGSGQKVRMLWQHDMAKPIGVWDEMREDERGLYVKGRINKDVRLGAEAIALYKMGAMDSLSIGYQVQEASPEAGGRVRRINKAKLWEISAVTIPMNPQATAQVKAIDWANKRDVEAGLRDVFGLTQAEAKAFIADGFAGLAAKRDVEPAEVKSDDNAVILDQLRLLQEKLHV